MLGLNHRPITLKPITINEHNLRSMSSSDDFPIPVEHYDTINAAALIAAHIKAKGWKKHRATL